jgi:hypothetical protein
MNLATIMKNESDGVIKYPSAYVLSLNWSSNFHTHKIMQS